MNFKILGLHVMSVAAEALHEAGGHAAVDVAITEKDRVIALAKAGDLGRQAVAAIDAAEDPSLSGAQKAVKAFAAFSPEMLKFAQTGDPKVVESDVESLGREFLQSVFNDVKSKAAGVAVSALATAFHL